MNLYASARCSNVCLNSCSVVTSGKFLFQGLLTFHNWDCQQLLVDVLVQVQDAKHLQQSPHTARHLTLINIIHSKSDTYINSLLCKTCNSNESDCTVCTSVSASAYVACAEWPSCHRNSLVLINGCGCLNSHL